MGVPGVHQAKQTRRRQAHFPRLAPPPHPSQRYPRRARRSNANAAAVGLVACGAGGGSSGASSPPRRICAAGRTEPPGSGRRRRERCCWRVRVSLSGPDHHVFFQQCAAEAKHRRYFGGGALLVGQAVLGDRRGQIVGHRCGSAPSAVSRNNTYRCANSRSMARPPAVGGWSSNLTPAMLATPLQPKHTSRQREYKPSMPHGTGNRDRCVSRRQWEAMRTLLLSEGMRLIGGKIGVRVLHINSTAAHRRAAKK
jgi:hypothetical protein